jgi:thymidylate kinase
MIARPYRKRGSPERASLWLLALSDAPPYRGSIIKEIDRHLPERALVVASRPPAAQELELLVAGTARQALQRALADDGWLVIDRRCARFENCTAEVVELLAVQDTGVPGQLRPALFERASPLDGATSVCAPAPHHGLLLLACRLARSGRPLLDRHRATISAYLEAAPAAWDQAAAEAPEWSAERALALLRQAYEGGGDALSTRLARRLRGKGFVVAFSGLDGAGKSTQARALKDALERLGYVAEIRWSSLLHYPPSLELLRRTINRALLLTKLAGQTKPPAAGPDSLPTHGGVGPTDTAAKRLRMRSPAVAFLWVSLVAARNALEHRRITRGSGRVVICDRYVLDSLVQLRYEFGMHPVRLQSWLVRVLSPRADCAFFLEVAPDTASARKEEYRIEENERRARLYDEEWRELDVQWLDGERDPAALCAEVAASVWRALARGR